MADNIVSMGMCIIENPAEGPSGVYERSGWSRIEETFDTPVGASDTIITGSKFLQLIGGAALPKVMLDGMSIGIGYFYGENESSGEEDIPVYDRNGGSIAILNELKGDFFGTYEICDGSSFVTIPDEYPLLKYQIPVCWDDLRRQQGASLSRTEEVDQQGVLSQKDKESQLASVSVFAVLDYGGWSVDLGRLSLPEGGEVNVAISGGEMTVIGQVSKIGANVGADDDVKLKPPAFAEDWHTSVGVTHDNGFYITNGPGSLNGGRSSTVVYSHRGATKINGNTEMPSPSASARGPIEQETALIVA